VWQEWTSRTAKKPFWHCKATGETRWEKPEYVAVQKPDKNPGENLIDGELDEDDNRREFLKALYEWRNGGSSGPEAEGTSQLARQQPHTSAQGSVSKKPAESSSQKSSSRPGSAALRRLGSRAPQNVTIHTAAGKGETRTVEMMIKAKTDPNVADRFGASPLHYAAGGNHSETVHILVSLGANVDARNTDEDTPLHAAVKAGKVKATRKLIRMGADINALNARKKSASQMASLFGYKEIVRMMEKAEEVRAGPDFDIPSETVDNPTPQDMNQSNTQTTKGGVQWRKSEPQAGPKRSHSQSTTANRTPAPNPREQPVKEVKTQNASGGGLLDGEFDEEANRREFLAALNEWRSGTSSVTAETVSQPTASSDNPGVSTTTQGNSLLDGEFDEEANRREFLAALNDWRGGDASTKNENSGTATVAGDSRPHSRGFGEGPAAKQPAREAPSQASVDTAAIEARLLLEGLRMKAKQDAEMKYTGSRPTSAAAGTDD